MSVDAGSIFNHVNVLNGKEERKKNVTGRRVYIIYASNLRHQNECR